MSISAAVPDPSSARVPIAEPSTAVRLLTLLASLKLTCVLFVLAMIIVFIGSLAQARRDVWLVMADYFRCYVAFPMLCLRAFSARNLSFYPNFLGTPRFFIVSFILF